MSDEEQSPRLQSQCWIVSTGNLRRKFYNLTCSVLILSLIVSQAHGQQCAGTDQDNCQERSVGSLLPSDLPPPVVFNNFTNATGTLSNGKEMSVAIGKVTQINRVDDSNADDSSIDPATKFSVLPQALSRDSIDKVLGLLESYEYYDEDPDTVDGMPTYEIFVESPDLYDSSNKMKSRDTDPKFQPQRMALRENLQSILQPYLKNVITPFVQENHPQACLQKGADRQCTPCYSLIRRYQHGDRVSHATHHDGHAIVTVVVSLSDYNVDYRGGLYVSTGYGQRAFLALNKGDAVVHQSTLLHGVQVYDIEDMPEETHRWSWILWYRDSTECHDYSYEWFSDCAKAGSPLCQQLHSTKVGNIPGIAEAQVASQVLELNRKAAQGGAGMAAVKVARAYLHQLPSNLKFDVDKAAQYFQMAIDSHHPDGHYGMAQLLLTFVTQEQMQEIKKEDKGTAREAYRDPKVIQAVQHLEAAAELGSAYAQFNLGMVHTYGYATGDINGTKAASWFVQSGLPEGYFVAAHQAQAVGDQQRYLELEQRAKALGFMAPWRKQARDATGSGGAAGVSLNLPWPVSMDGRQAPDF